MFLGAGTSSIGRQKPSSISREIERSRAMRRWRLKCDLMARAPVAPQPLIYSSPDDLMATLMNCDPFVMYLVMYSITPCSTEDGSANRMDR